MAGMPDTLAQPVSHTLEVKHSRFIAHAAPIDGGAAAMAFLQQVAVADATHNCWAYRHGQDYRSSDDGEPAGTAGRPILAAIDGQGFDRVMVVVTRWFGGIQLGTGGLARAYGGSAAKCLQTGERLRLVARVRCHCHCRFAELALIKARLPEFDALIEAEAFDADGACLLLALPVEQLPALQRSLADLSRGRIVLQPDAA